MVNLGAIKNRGKTNKPRIEANANLEANLKLLIKPGLVCDSASAAVKEETNCTSRTLMTLMK